VRGDRALTFAATVGVLLLAPCALQGQRPRSFRAGVDLLTVEVRVLDRQGRPVQGLRPEDFQVELDGQRRPVQAMEYIEFGFARTSTAPAAPPPFQPLPSEPDGRSVLIAFDDLSFRTNQARTILADVTNWLSRLDPRDRVAVRTTSGTGAALEWSTNRANTATTLGGLMGRRDRTGPVSLWAVVSIEEARASTGCTIHFEGEQAKLDNCNDVATEVYLRECAKADDPRGCVTALTSETRRVRDEADREATLQTGGLTDILRELARAPAPRILVLVSRGLPLEHTTDLALVAREATSAGVSVFVLTSANSAAGADLPIKLSPVGLMPDEARRRDDAFSLAGIETVAGVTNGRSHVAVGSADTFLEQILTETSGYYLLGVESPPGGGDWMSLKVATRAGRTSLHAASRIARPGTAIDSVTAPASLEERLVSIVKRGGLVRGLRVELATGLRRDPLGQRLQVTANVRLRESRPGPLQALFVLLGLDGRIVSDGQLTLVPRHAEPGYRAAFHLPVLPGRYLLRIGVADAQGDMGLAEKEVVARLTRIGSYHASDLVVAWVGTDNQLQYPELDEVPGSAVGLHMLLELYAAEGRPTVVPRVRLHIEPSAGGAAITRDMEVAVGGTVARARAEIAAPILPPGEYLIRAVVLEGERETGTVSTVVRMAAPVSPS
jgi:VWFA-related protein